MRARTLPLLIFVVVVSPALLPFAIRPGFAEEQVAATGEVVDLACYVGHGAKGPDHQKCALKCAQVGQPIGLLTGDGKLYLLVADHSNGAPFERARKLAGQKATVKGEGASRDGMNTLTVEEVTR